MGPGRALPRPPGEASGTDAGGGGGGCPEWPHLQPVALALLRPECGVDGEKQGGIWEKGVKGLLPALVARLGADDGQRSGL